MLSQIIMKKRVLSINLEKMTLTKCQIKLQNIKIRNLKGVMMLKQFRTWKILIKTH